MSEDPTHETSRRIARALRAGIRGFALVTTEEDRAIARLEEVGEALGWPVHTWSAAAGVDGDGSARPLDTLLGELRRRHDDALFVVLDGVASLAGATAIRTLRELAQRERGPAVVLIEPSGTSDRASLLERIHAPIGLPIGAASPAEIAVATLAEIIKALRQRDLATRSSEEHAA